MDFNNNNNNYSDNKHNNTMSSSCTLMSSKSKTDNSNDIINFNDSITINTKNKTYTFPRKNLLKTKNSIFGFHFLNQKTNASISSTSTPTFSSSNYNTEMDWSIQDNPIAEEFILAWLAQNDSSTPLDFDYSKMANSLTTQKSILIEMKKVNMYNDFIHTSGFSRCWARVLDLNLRYNQVLSCYEWCECLVDIWIRAITMALHQNLYTPEYEVTKSGLISLNRKDVTSLIIHDNENEEKGKKKEFNEKIKYKNEKEKEKEKEENEIIYYLDEKSEDKMKNHIEEIKNCKNEGKNYENEINNNDMNHTYEIESNNEKDKKKKSEGTENNEKEIKINEHIALSKFYLYSNIEPFFQTIYQQIIHILYPYPNQKELLAEAESMNNGRPLMCVTTTSLPDEEAKCCFQSCFHCHVRINLIPYINFCFLNKEKVKN